MNKNVIIKSKFKFYSKIKDQVRPGSTRNFFSRPFVYEFVDGKPVRDHVLTAALQTPTGWSVHLRRGIRIWGDSVRPFM